MNFEEVSLENIEEGRFRNDLNAELQGVMQKLVFHMQSYGAKAEGAKASIKAEIEMELVNVDDGSFAVKAKLSTKLPQRPVRGTTALAGEVAGRPTLKCQVGGTSFDNPRQMRFTLPADAIHQPIDDEPLREED